MYIKGRLFHTHSIVELACIGEREYNASAWRFKLDEEWLTVRLVIIHVILSVCQQLL